MGPDQQRLTPSERADLVAYLDGELGEAESRAIATKLAHSATARREIESLEKTWELLEYLPRPRAGDDFTARTLSEVTRAELEGGRFDSKLSKTFQDALRVVTWIVAGCLAFGLGYVLMTWAWPNPSERLTRDLPIAEHLDEYRDVGSFEFLKQLADSPEFNADRD